MSSSMVHPFFSPMDTHIAHWETDFRFRLTSDISIYTVVYNLGDATNLRTENDNINMFTLFKKTAFCKTQAVKVTTIKYCLQTEVLKLYFLRETSKNNYSTLLINDMSITRWPPRYSILIYKPFLATVKEKKLKIQRNIKRLNHSDESKPNISNIQS